MANDFNQNDELKNATNLDANQDELNTNAQSVDPYSREEYAAEVAPNIVDFNRREQETTRTVARVDEDANRDLTASETNVDDVTGGRGIGGLALALSILSLFVMPIILGAAGIIIGFIARRRGSTTLGAWAIGIGAVSIIVGMFVLPFF
ncbi:DUF4190 domain-containing protein [Bacillus pinisoli]|uniref:DUF4190 domain-containing protein n=1 Tax=Bacillus pinisoli TaxID=2901866 RepID=UPI001FF64054|nr:DUF4190 domain-containing protein [Bacillus pinisoli]